MLPKKFKIVTNKRVFAIQRKDRFFWNWEGGIDRVARNYGNPSFPKLTFELEKQARNYIAERYGELGTERIINNELKWEKV